MNTYGMHSIHGRAPAIATGLAASRPDLSVWVVTGDGDALSIGGNHLIHALRRNVNLKILLFNNRIYGLTKGQYSPTSEVGKRTKSTPLGSLDTPFNPVSVALGAEASFVARTIDSDRQHLTSVLQAAAVHPGTALVEIYQNCNIFNDGAFEPLKDATSKDEVTIRLEHGKPIRFGIGGHRGVIRDCARPAGGGRRRPGRRGRAGGARRPRRGPVDRVRAVPAVPPGDPGQHPDRHLPRRHPGHLRLGDERADRHRHRHARRRRPGRACSPAGTPGPSADRQSDPATSTVGADERWPPAEAPPAPSVRSQAPQEPQRRPRTAATRLLAAHGVRARAEIIEAARDLFTRNGYQATTVEAIGEATGRSGAAVYQYFAGKSEIFGDLPAGVRRRAAAGGAAVSAADGRRRRPAEPARLDRSS